MFQTPDLQASAADLGLRYSQYPATAPLPSRGKALFRIVDEAAGAIHRIVRMGCSPSLEIGRVETQRSSEPGQETPSGSSIAGQTASLILNETSARLPPWH